MRPKWSSSSSSSSPTSIKLKTLFLNLITGMTKKKKVIRDKPKKKKLIKGSLYRLLRSLSKAKSYIKDISKFNKKRFFRMIKTTKPSLKRCNVFSGSSSFVVPYTESFSFSIHGHEDEDNQDRYLGWLEENNNSDDDDHSVGEIRHVGDDDDINRLAEMFIARCHDKFLMEKVESYRRFQDMLARGL